MTSEVMFTFSSEMCYLGVSFLSGSVTGYSTSFWEIPDYVLDFKTAAVRCQRQRNFMFMKTVWVSFRGGGLLCFRSCERSYHLLILFPMLSTQLKLGSTCASFHSLNITLSAYPQTVLGLSFTFWEVFSAIISEGRKR